MDRAHSRVRPAGREANRQLIEDLVLVPLVARGAAVVDGVDRRYDSAMAASVDFTIAFDEPDEDGWIVARVLEVPGAMSQGRTREEARANVLDALSTVLTPDDELAGERTDADLEHLRFVAA